MATDRVNASIAARLSQGTSARLSTDRQISAPVKTGIAVLDTVEAHAIRHGCVVDIVGVSNSGKTRFLHAIIANQLSSPPPDHPCHPRVCWFNLNGGLDVEFLLQMISRRLNRRPQDLNFVLNALRIYNPSSTTSMCESIMHLPEYFHTVEGSNVSSVVIDALGSFHYFDKFDGDCKATIGEPQTELQFVKAIKQLQATSHVMTFVTKCALFESEKLTATWPKNVSFSPAELPSIPRDIMPKAWQTVVSHVILLYHVANEPDTYDNVANFGSLWVESVAENNYIARRGIIAMAFVQPNRTSPRQLTAYATSTLQISDNDIVCP